MLIKKSDNNRGVYSPTSPPAIVKYWPMTSFGETNVIMGKRERGACKRKEERQKIKRKLRLKMFKEMHGEKIKTKKGV
jgi:hypothetical protein